MIYYVLLLVYVFVGAELFHRSGKMLESCPDTRKYKGVISVKLFAAMFWALFLFMDIVVILECKIRGLH